MLAVLLTIGLLGCGSARREPGAQDHPVRLRFDEELTLRLEEVISGVVGSATLRDPVSLATTPSGQLVILERGGPRLILLGPDRRVVRETGISGVSAARSIRPRWVRAGFAVTYNVVTEQGQLLTYDSQLRLVGSFEPSAEVSGFSGRNLSGLAIAPFGDTFVGDRDNEVIYHFDPGGRLLGTIGGPDAGLGRLNRPEGLAVTADGRLIICDTGARRVVFFDENGQFHSSLGEGALFEPVAVALAPDERAVFVCDRREPQLLRYSLEGRQLSSWNGLTFIPDGFQAPTDVVAVDSSLWVVDAGRDRVMRFRIVPGAE